MFREIKLETFRIEAVTHDFMLRADFQPRGPFLAFLNDRNWEFLPFLNGELAPLAADSPVGSMRQDQLSVNKHTLGFLCLLDQDLAAKVQIPLAARQTIFYVGQFAIRGKLHVTSDAPDEDMLDDLHDFYPITDCSIFPIRPVSAKVSKHVPMLFINRILIQSYAVQKSTSSPG